MRAGKKRKIGFRVIALTVLIICGVVLYSKHALDREYEALQQQKQALEQSIQEEEERSEEIKEYGVYVKTKKFIEDVARNILGLTEPDDIVIKDGKE